MSGMGRVRLFTPAGESGGDVIILPVTLLLAVFRQTG